MLDSMSKSLAPTASLRVTLKKMWKVVADGSYSARKDAKYGRVYIALRTVSGKGEIGISGQRELLGAGTLIVFKYEDLDFYKSDGEGWSFYWFEFDSDSMDLPLSYAFVVESVTAEIEKMEKCFSLLPIDEESEYLSTVFAGLLGEWIHGHGKQRTEEQLYVKRAINYIMNNINKNISAEEIASAAGLGQRQLCNMFKEYTGKTAQDYLTELRIKNAEELLRFTSMSIKTIAYSLGFQNQYYFSGFFKKHTGMSPTDYRNKWH